jgi:ADP-heptose:LPS heptosyltransferase
MNLALQRTIDRRLGAPLCRILSLWPRPTAQLPQDPRAILVILLSEMGSLVLAAPMLRHLRERYPRAHLYALVFEKNREMLDLLGLVAPGGVLTIRDTTVTAFVRDGLQVLWRLRQLGLDAVIDCELFARVSSLIARLSGAPLHAGFHAHTQEGLYRGGFINRPVLYNPYVHLSHQYLSLAAALDSDTRPLGKRRVGQGPLRVPLRGFPEQEKADYLRRLLGDFPVLQDRRLVLIYPGGGILPIRAWPRQSYLELCRALITDDLAVGIIGLSSDQSQAQQLVAECASPQCLDMTGYTRSVRELLLLLSHSALLVTNDGGPGQFAALTPVPSIVLFGPETPLLYGSLAPNAHFFFAGLSCSPCLTAYNHRQSPCDGDNLCLKAICPAAVLAKARELLAAPQPA